MATINSLTLILCLQTLLFIISISSTHSKIFQPNDERVLQFTCSKTPYPNRCVASLLFAPNSYYADVRGLGQLMIDFAMKLEAKAGLQEIQELQLGGNKPGLDSCAKKYKTILDTDIPKASVAYNKENFNSALIAANDAANQATSCETAFPGKLTDRNKIMKEVSANAAAIILKLKGDNGGVLY
ncbi:hypothetical protein RIF29_07099 [Crotalaria pallida]|uniref:Pectinesterase inhibitor domain-containing protein n=1 Tax=Crotalaria pallida TaxID=3830 RepID=A0AAN9PAN4_CROPI